MSGAPSAKVYLERGDTKICLMETKVSEAVSNKVLKFTYPKIGAGQSNSTNQVKFKDLKRIDFSYTVTGFVDKQTATVDGSSVQLTAPQAKNIFIYKIIYGSGAVNFYWRGLASSSANPTTGLSDLMASDDSARVTNAIIELIRFSDSPKDRLTFKYNQSDGYTVDTAEYNASRYGIQLRLTKGVSF